LDEAKNVGNMPENLGKNVEHLGKCGTMLEECEKTIRILQCIDILMVWLGIS
jgi:hypothetical protein